MEREGRVLQFGYFLLAVAALSALPLALAEAPASPASSNEPPSTSLAMQAAIKAGNIDATTTDPNSISSIKLLCSDDGKTGVSSRKCEPIKTELLKILRLNISHVVANFYEGKLLGYDDEKGFCVENGKVSTPICSIEKGSLEDTNWKNETCGANAVGAKNGYCNYDSTGTINFASCGKEVSWYLGTRVLGWEHYLEEVVSEIEGGKLKVVNFGTKEDAARPCTPYAAAMIRALYSADAILATESDSQKIAAQNGVAHFCKDGKSQSPGSQSACQLEFAYANMDALFQKLATCEVMYRAKGHFYNIQKANEAFGQLFGMVITPCSTYARNQTTGDFYDHYYKCYNGTIKGKLGAKKFFENFMKTTYATTGQATHEKQGETTEACPWVKL